jgi:hypothetical protein
MTTTRDDLILSLAESIDKARKVGFGITIRQAEFALAIELTDEERTVLKELLIAQGHLMGVGY